MTGDPLFVGLELGGTKCVCTLAAAPPDILDQRTIPTTTPAETLGRIEEVLEEWSDRAGFRALGIASFGPVDLNASSPTYGFITTTTKPGWPGTDVARRLKARFQVPVAFDTDVNGAALAEMRWGAAQGLADFAYVTVGTGVGVGLIVDGKPARGFGHPELGHIRVPRLPGDDWPGACPFHGGCVEGLASGSALKARLGSRSINELPQEDLFWTSVAYTLAQLCHVLACSTAPLRIAIGGGVVERQPHLLGRIEEMLVESLAGYIEVPNPRPYIIAPGLGGLAGPLGSIALAMDFAR